MKKVDPNNLKNTNNAPVNEFKTRSTQHIRGFFELLERSGYRLHSPVEKIKEGVTLPKATTVLAFHFKDGVIMAAIVAPRRATASCTSAVKR